MTQSEQGDSAVEFCEYLKVRKPIMAMVHLKGTSAGDRLDRAKREIDIYLRGGVDAVLVENYFGSARDCEAVLRHLHDNLPHAVYGVNILDNHELAFRLAGDYGARFIQIDSVCGHLPPKEDVQFAESLAELRAGSRAAVLGGVRFKYQAELSGRSELVDLALGTARCDAIVTTGDGTGLPTPMAKLRRFRLMLKEFPLVVGAGVTADTVAENLSVCDGAIVGSWLKVEHRDTGDVSARNVRQFMAAARGMA